MFAVIGKGQIQKSDLIGLLAELGVTEPNPIVDEIERRGRAIINDMRIMYVR